MLKKITLKGEQKKVLFLPPDNPIQIKGVAGSGKTTVALFRAKHLLDTQSELFQDAKVVIFTFSTTLSAYIKAVAPNINSGYQKDNDKVLPNISDGLNVEIINFHKWAYRYLGLEYNQTVMRNTQVSIIDKVKRSVDSRGSSILDKNTEFFLEEISWIKGKMLTSINDYIDIKRTGRGTSDRVTKEDKYIIWDVYDKYNHQLSEKGKIDFDDYAILCLNKMNTSKDFVPPYTHIIIDEAQDLSKAQILTISKLVEPHTNSLTIIADAAQRIFKSGFVWSEVGINVRGNRTVEFKKNYRNSASIVKAALSLLDNENDKSEFTSIETTIKAGNKPKIGRFDNYAMQVNQLDDELWELVTNNLISGTVILHRTNSGVRDIREYLESIGHKTELIKSSKEVNYDSDVIKVCTMSSVKGLEFNNVFIIDLNDDVVPFPPGSIGEDDELHISTERRLLYTCMTRAINNLYLFSSGRPSRYLGEIEGELLEDVSIHLNKDVVDDRFDDIPF